MVFGGANSIPIIFCRRFNLHVFNIKMLGSLASSTLGAGIAEEAIGKIFQPFQQDRLRWGRCIVAFARFIIGSSVSCVAIRKSHVRPMNILPCSRRFKHVNKQVGLQQFVKYRNAHRNHKEHKHQPLKTFTLFKSP